MVGRVGLLRDEKRRFDCLRKCAKLASAQLMIQLLYMHHHNIRFMGNLMLID